MRIYLACTVRGDRNAITTARHIHDRLVAAGHKVLTSHLLRDDVEEVEQGATDEHVYARDLDWLTSADVIVAEASGSSYGVGFEVGFTLGRAAHSGQRVFVLYQADKRGKVSRLISGMLHEQAEVLAYGSIDEIDAFLEKHQLVSAGAETQD